MKNLYTYFQGRIVPLESTEGDLLTKELIRTEFDGKATKTASSTEQLIRDYGFGWDPLSIPGYLTFKPYAAFMVEAVKLRLWKQAQTFCFENDIPLHRIVGGDLYSLDSELMKKHVQLAEEVGMYGDALLTVSGNQVLRFSGCSNKLSLLRQQCLDGAEFPFGIFELSNSYRFESDEAIEYLSRNRKFHLPELHIVNKKLLDGLNLLLRGHDFIDQSMKKHRLSYVMLLSTTRKFVTENMWFFERLCDGCAHIPVIDISDGDNCENGIIFDVEYKASMQNGALLEIATLQIDEGNTGFAYGIQANGKPVVTIHAVFFASSVERTIYTYLDIAAGQNHEGVLPAWLAPIHYRILPETDAYMEKAEKVLKKLLASSRAEFDDRPLPFGNKLRDGLEMKIPCIIRVGNTLSRYDESINGFRALQLEQLLSGTPDESFVLGQFSPAKLSRRVL